MRQSTDLVICGAGITGIATAYYLTKYHHMTNNIIVVDPHAPLSQTTAKSGENYRNWWPFPPLAAFTNRSIDLMEMLAAETGNLFQMHRRGYLYVSATDDVDGFVAQLRATYAWATEHIRTHNDYTNTYVPVRSDNSLSATDGIDILTDPQIIRRWFPHLATNLSVAVHIRRAGALSIQLLGSYLWDQARAAGARFCRGEVTAIRQDGQGIAGVTVQTPDGASEIQTRIFVNAAGPFMPHVARLADVELPAYSVFQQKIALPDPHGVLPRNAPFTIFLDGQTVNWSDEERVFWAKDPEYQWLLQQFPGGLHIRPEGSGDSTWIKLGWAINQAPENPHWSPQGSPEFPELLIRGATRFIPGLAHYVGRLPQSLTHYGGYYTKTKENLPLIGPMGVPGAYMVGALSGYGTMASCAAGELCAAWIAGTALPDYAQVFSLHRYENPESRALMAQLAETGEL